MWWLWEARRKFCLQSAPSFARGRVPCLSNAVIFLETVKLWASFCECSFCSTSRQFLWWIGICMRDCEEEGAEVGFGFAFGAGLFASAREEMTFLVSCPTSFPIPCESFSASLPGIRASSVKSLANLLRPFEILTHEWNPSPDQELILISIPCVPWW